MAERKLAYAASVEIDIDPEGLATSATRVAGVESTAVVNTSNKYLNALVGGRIRAGTTPTAGKQIDVWVYRAMKVVAGTPTYPDVITGTKGARTLTSADIRNTALKIAPEGAVAIVDATTGRDYFFAFELKDVFEDAPEFWGLFVTHDGVAALDATAGDHEFWYQGITETVT